MSKPQKNYKRILHVYRDIESLGRKVKELEAEKERVTRLLSYVDRDNRLYVKRQCQVNGMDALYRELEGRMADQNNKLIFPG